MALYRVRLRTSYSRRRKFLALFPAGKTYYVANGGSDSNNGLTPATAWQTIAGSVNVTGSTKPALNGGDSILFNGGQTFTGGIVMAAANFGTSPAPDASNPVTFGSFGTGQATISSSTSKGWSGTHIGCFVITNLIFTGDGVTGSNNTGISIVNNDTAATMFDHVQVSNCTVSGYGRYGIAIQNGTSNGAGGFTNIVVLGNVVHDCGGFVGPIFTAGINISANPTTAIGLISPNFTNVLVSGNNVYNITGNGGTSGDSGFPIWLSECGNATIQLCTAHDSGTNNGNVGAGPAGIQLVDSINSVIQFCEVYNMSDGGHGVDGDGYNIATCNNCIIQYCYSHDNNGAGYLIDNGAAAGPVTACTLRYCVSQNDGNDASVNLQYGLALVCENATYTVAANVYNNTVYSNNGSGGIFIFLNVGNISGRVCNNIFYTTTGESVSTAGNPPVTFDGNNYYRTSGTSLIWNGTTYTTLAAWKAAFTGQETVNGGFATNPLLVNPGGAGIAQGYNPASMGAYLLQSGSSMVNAGINLSTAFSINPGTHDFNGVAVPRAGSTGYNVGAMDTAWPFWIRRRGKKNQPSRLPRKKRLRQVPQQVLAAIFAPFRRKKLRRLVKIRPPIRRTHRFPTWLFQQGASWISNVKFQRRGAANQRKRIWRGNARLLRLHRFPAWLVQQGAYWLRRKTRRPVVRLARPHKSRRSTAWIVILAAAVFTPFRRLHRHYQTPRRPPSLRLRRYAGWTIQQGAYWLRRRKRRLWAVLSRPRKRRFFPQQFVAAIATYIPRRRKRRPTYPAWLGPPPQRRVRRKIVTQWVTLLLTQRAWNWNGQAGLLAAQLGTVAKAWVWQAQSALSQGWIGASKAWAWVKNAPVSGGGLALVSKVWRWATQASTIAGGNFSPKTLIQTLISFCYPGWKKGP